MPYTHEISDIPTKQKADEIILQFISDGCTAKKKKQANNKWTVKASCPVD